MHVVPGLVNAAAVAVNAVAATANGSVLKDVVTAEMMNGVLDEVIGVLPVCIPVMISFISLRKGISFVMGVLRSA